MPRCRQGSYDSQDDFNLPDRPHEGNLQDCALRKVRFLDDQGLRAATNASTMSVHQITRDLQRSYDAISYGLDLLRQLYDDLLRSKECMQHCPNEFKSCGMEDVNKLLEETEQLRTVLSRAAERKKHYMDDLTSLQATLHADREKMEEWVKLSQDSKRSLQTKLCESSKITKEQQSLIKKLKKDNESLWMILQEIQNHLREEKFFMAGDLDERYLQPTAERSAAVYDCEGVSFARPGYGTPDSNHEGTLKRYFDSSQSYRDSLFAVERSESGSACSSEEPVLSNKLKNLLDQGKNIQVLMKRAQHLRHDASYGNLPKPPKQADVETLCSSSNMATPRRIPSEDERGVRSDMGDLMRRCQELEQRVKECSAKDIRERIVQEMDKLTDVQTHFNCCTSCNNDCSPHRHEKDTKQDFSEHRRAREELLRCLDKIAALERNFTDAQDEIIHLRNYIKETAEEKEFCEQTYKREAIELRTAVEDKDEEICKLRDLLSEARTQLDEHENVCELHLREQEDLLRDREKEIRILKEDLNDARLLKANLEAKSKELDSLRAELLSTVKDLELLRTQGVTHEDLRQENISLQVKITTLQAQNAALATRRDENITEELRSLQAAIEETERKLKRDQLASAAQVEMFERCKLEWLSEHEALQVKLEEKDRQLVRDKAEHEVELKRLRDKLRLLHSSYESDVLKKHLLRQQHMSDYTDKRINGLNKENKNLEELILQKDDIIAEQQLRLDELLSLVEGTGRGAKMKKDIVVSRLARVDMDDNQLAEELSTMRSELGASHDELVDRILDLDRKVSALRDENRELRQLASKHEPDIVNSNLDLHRQVLSLTKERDILAETINKSYPGLVEGTIYRGEELRRLSEENQALRSHIGLSKLQLVDRVMNLESKISDLQERLVRQASRSPVSLRSTRSRSQSPVSPSRSGRRRSHSPRILRTQPGETDVRSPSLRNRTAQVFGKAVDHVSLDEVDYAEKEELCQQISELRLANETLRQERDVTRETLDKGTKNVINKCLQQISRIQELQDENNQLKAALSNAGSLQSRDFIIVNELENLRNERAELRKIIENLGINEYDLQRTKENQRVLDELHLLRDIIENYGDTVPFGGYGRRVRDLQNEIDLLKSSERRRAPSPSRQPGAVENRSFSPSRHPEFQEQQKKLKDMHAENVRLRGELEKTTGNLTKLAKILEKEKSNSSADKSARIKAERLEEKLVKLDSENEKLKSEVARVMQRNTALEKEVSKLTEEATALTESKTQTLLEMKNLRSLVDQMTARGDDQGLREKLKALNSEMDELRRQNSDLERQLRISHEERKKLDQESHQSRLAANSLPETKERLRNIENERNQLKKELSRVNSEAEEHKKRNKDLEGERMRLEQEFDKMQNELSEKHFNKWLQTDASKRLAQLSPEGHLDTEEHELQPDEEKLIKREQGRLVRRLQVENQTLKAKLSSLEDEAVATTKIISDLERGHGHLTGTLRCHLILQQGSTGKLLEGALHQYQSEHESLKKKFQALEDNFDREKQYSKRRHYAWDCFKNASGTLNNIHTILSEGLIKVVDDIEKDLADEGFEARDYKSRLWILRRRLSEVENRHREVQLRAEELSIRLDAKTAEFEVTQDELEDITRDLEHKEGSMKDLKGELIRISKENAELKDILKKFKENQEKTIGSVMSTNESLRLRAEEVISSRDTNFKLLEEETNNLKKLLEDRNDALKALQKSLQNLKSELTEKDGRVAKLEAKLKEITDERDQLRREAGYRAGYMPNLTDHHGTIHLLRDDIKKLSKENSDLKQDIVTKTRQIYDMSKDLNRLRQETGEGVKRVSSKKTSSVSSAEALMLSEIAKAKVEHAILAAKYSELRTKYQALSGSDIADTETEAILVENQIRNMQDELEKLRQENFELQSNLADLLEDNEVHQKPSKDHLQDEIDRLTEENKLLTDIVNDKSKTPGAGQKILKELRENKKEIELLKNENLLLNKIIEQKNMLKEAELAKVILALETKIEQQQAELESLNADLDAKRLRIRELLGLVDSLNKKPAERSDPVVSETVRSIRKTELDSMATMLDNKTKEADLWKDQVEYLQREIERLRASHSTAKTAEDDGFQRLYLNFQPQPDSKSATVSHLSVTPDGGARSKSTSSTPGSPAGNAVSPLVSRGVLIADVPGRISSLDLEEAQSEDAARKPNIKEPLVDVKRTRSHYQGDAKGAPSLPPKGSKIGDNPSRIPISPVKLRQEKKMTASEDIGTRPTKSDNVDRTSMSGSSRESMLERQLQEQHADIQTLLLSVDHFERENELLKAKLNAGTGP